MYMLFMKHKNFFIAFILLAILTFISHKIASSAGTSDVSETRDERD